MREIMDSELEPALEHSTKHSAADVRGWMEREFEEAQRERAPAALMRLRVEGFERIAPRPDRRRVVLSTLLEGVRAAPRAGDLFALREGDDLIVLLPGTAPEAAEVIARQSIERARKLALPGAPAPERASLCIGLAHAQNDLDLYFETLLQVAEEGLAVASQSGGETCVHTQLYGLFQRQIERVRGPRAPRSAAPPKYASAPQPTATLGAASVAPHTSASPNGSMPALEPSTTRSFTEPAPIEHRASNGVALNGAATNGLEASALFEARILSAFTEDTRGQSSPEEIERRVLELSRAWADEALGDVMKRTEERHRSEIDLYERRLQKLTQALSATEEELRRIANLKAIDPGVASAYRTVQGLDQSENQYSTKLSLLAKLLQANLELRAQLGGAAPAT
jgi:GGDEF domain-containing protein